MLSSAFPRSAAIDFDPSRDGFSFPNTFRWTDADLAVLSSRLRPLSAAPVALAAGLGGWLAGTRRGGLAALATGAVLGRAGAGDGVVRAVARRWPTFGLCGGMALAAAERWPASPAAASTAELRPGPLRALLRKRQERTLRASLSTFAAWWLRALAMRGPDGPFVESLNAELDAVEARLAAGRPVVLGLVGDAPDPTSLHQVVVFAIERRGAIDATLSVYDPNAPGRTRVITTGPSDRPGCTHLTTTIPTGPRPSGRVSISRRPGHLAHVFVVPV